MQTRFDRLRTIVEDVETPDGRAFDLVVQGLIIVSVVVFVLETEPYLAERHARLFHAAEWALVSAFTVEYLLRLMVARRPLRFVFSFYGLVDLLSIAPFYLGLAVDLRALRSLRLLRIFRVLKLARYSRSVQRYRRALALAREDLMLFGVTTMVLLLLASVGIHYFEGHAQPEKFGSVASSFWWAVISLTTVGYGDVYPVTAGGKFFTSVVLFTGLGLVAVPSGLLASALSQARREEGSDDGGLRCSG